MAHFPPQLLEQIRAASDIVDVIGAALPLKRAGSNFVCLCPFHKEKSPSFNVHPGKQIFHCFGCQKGGDVFKFVQLYENISFPEAVARLAEHARIPIETDNDPAARQTRGLKDALLKLHEAITKRWQQCLENEASGQIARDYLARRGVSPDAVREFRLGAAPESWDDTVNWAKGQGFEAALCEQAGLILRKEETGRLYDRFRGRLMFPICDEQGRVIAFSGRVLSGDEKVAKYVNSPETPLFTKGRVLFALDKAKRAILDAGHAVICEGQLDTIACHSAGIRNVVAPQGTALTPEHARILKRYVDEVVLCFDGDKAGRNASIRSFDGLLGSGLAVRVATIPPPDDPDSYIRQHGAESFREILKSSQGYFDFLLKHLMLENDASTDRGRMAVVRSLAEAVNKTGNAVLVDTHAQKAAQRLGVNVESVRSEFRKARRAAPSEPGPEESGPPPGFEEEGPGPMPPAPALETWLLKYVLLTPDLSHFAALHLDPLWVTHPVVRRVIALHFAFGGDVAGLLGQFEGDDHARTLVAEAAAERRSIPEPEKQLADTILRLRNAALDREIVQRTARMTDPEASEAERTEALENLNRLRLAKRQPLALLGGSG
ncbi:MAG: DNA primase [Verrucomicrobiales bacterium]|nr:DNA primase [Verrucomicrobiales bacterium]